MSGVAFLLILSQILNLNRKSAVLFGNLLLGGVESMQMVLLSSHTS
jgi:hypothetical protein